MVVTVTCTAGEPVQAVAALRAASTGAARYPCRGRGERIRQTDPLTSPVIR